MAWDSLCGSVDHSWICAHASLICWRFWHRRSPCPQQAQPSCSTPAAAPARMDEVLFSRVENSGSPALECFQSLSRVPASVVFSVCWAELCRTKERCALPPAPSRAGTLWDRGSVRTVRQRETISLRLGLKFRREEAAMVFCSATAKQNKVILKRPEELSWL